VRREDREADLSGVNSIAFPYLELVSLTLSRFGIIRTARLCAVYGSYKYDVTFASANFLA